MRNFFGIEGKFFVVTSKMVDLVGITFLWLVGSIPIVTILTSTASMYQTTVKCIRYDRGKIFEEFKKAYKKNLKQGIALTLLFGSIGVVIAFGDYYVFHQLRSRSAMAFVLVVGMLVWSCLYLMNLIWIIPVFSRFSNTFANILRLNYVIATRYILRSTLMLFILAAAVLMAVVTIPLVIIMPSLLMLILSYFCEPCLHKYMPEQKEDSKDWRYGYK